MYAYIYLSCSVMVKVPQYFIASDKFESFILSEHLPHFVTVEA